MDESDQVVVTHAAIASYILMQVNHFIDLIASLSSNGLSDRTEGITGRNVTVTVVRIRVFQ